jgi:hypothetical protein
MESSRGQLEKEREPVEVVGTVNSRKRGGGKKKVSEAPGDARDSTGRASRKKGAAALRSDDDDDDDEDNANCTSIERGAHKAWAAQAPHLDEDVSGGGALRRRANTLRAARAQEAKQQSEQDRKLVERPPEAAASAQVRELKRELAAASVQSTADERDVGELEALANDLHEEHERSMVEVADLRQSLEDARTDGAEIVAHLDVQEKALVGEKAARRDAEAATTAAEEHLASALAELAAERMAATLVHLEDRAEAADSTRRHWVGSDASSDGVIGPVDFETGECTTGMVLSRENGLAARLAALKARSRASRVARWRPPVPSATGPVAAAPQRASKVAREHPPTLRSPGAAVGATTHEVEEEARFANELGSDAGHLVAAGAALEASRTAASAAEATVTARALLARDVDNLADRWRAKPGHDDRVGGVQSVRGPWGAGGDYAGRASRPAETFEVGHPDVPEVAASDGVDGGGEYGGTRVNGNSKGATVVGEAALNHDEEVHGAAAAADKADAVPRELSPLTHLGAEQLVAAAAGTVSHVAGATHVVFQHHQEFAPALVVQTTPGNGMPRQAVASPRETQLTPDRGLSRQELADTDRAQAPTDDGGRSLKQREGGDVHDSFGAGEATTAAAARPGDSDRCAGGVQLHTRRDIHAGTVGGDVLAVLSRTPRHRSGFSLKAIQRRGKWASDCWKIYVQDSRDTAHEVTARMVEAKVTLI